MNKEQIEKGFRKWCYYSYLPSDHLAMYSVKFLAERFFRANEYQTRKLIKRLESKGYVKKAHEGGMDEDGQVRCYHGWILTKRALNTKTGREEKQKVRDYIERLINES